MRTCFVLALCALANCLAAEDYMEVRIQGEVRSSASGAIELWLMHDRYGEGALQTRFAVIATKELEAPGPFEWTVLVPLDLGSGLSLYGWQDDNGDGVHCFPGTAIEREATILLSETARFELTAALQLEPACNGPQEGS